MEDFDVIIFKGTYTKNEVKEETKISQIKYKNGYCHKGFVYIYKNLNIDFIISLLNKNRFVYIAGHSLGAVLATFLSLDLDDMGFNYQTYIFGSPKICNSDLTQRRLNLYNFQNTSDLISNIFISLNIFTGENREHFNNIILFTDNYNCIINNHSLTTYYKWIKNNNIF